MSKTTQKKLIKDRDASVLRKVALPVPAEEMGTKKVNAILSKMKKALKAEEDGVAIAAPQIGESLRIFIVSARAFELTKRNKKNRPEEEFRDLTFINPEMVKVSKKKKKLEEGCLSVRWLYGEVERHDKVTITAYDEKGKLSTFGASGLIAQIFQHEIDHLNGILFIDKAENVRDLPPANENKE